MVLAIGEQLSRFVTFATRGRYTDAIAWQEK